LSAELDFAFLTTRRVEHEEPSAELPDDASEGDLSHAEVGRCRADRMGLRQAPDDAHKDVPIEVYAREGRAGQP
jgi:hypothetical protein